MKRLSTSLLFFSLFLSTLLSQGVFALTSPAGGVEAIVAFPEASIRDEFTTETIPVNPSPDSSRKEAGCEPIFHEHVHKNVSTDTSEQEFLGVVNAFVIVLEDIEYMNTETMYCTDGADTYYSCGFDKDSDLGEVIFESEEWNGTTVTYQTLKFLPGSPVGLVWRYGMEDPTSSMLKPWIWSGQQKVEAIHFEPTSYTEDIEVTTSSWTLIETFYFDAGEDPTDASNYHHIYLEEAAPYADELDPDGDYVYWWGENAVLTTTWIECPGEEGLCADLILTPNDLDYEHLDAGEVELSVVALDEEGNDITDEVTYNYIATDYFGEEPEGEFVIDRTFFDESDSSLEDVEASEVTYENPSQGDQIYVEVVGSGREDGGNCYAELTLPFCEVGEITYPESSVVDDEVYETEIIVEVKDNEGEDWPYPLVYSSTDEDATFDGEESPYETDDREIDEYQSEESATVTMEATNDELGFCTDKFTYTMGPEDEGICIDLEVEPEVVIVEEEEDAEFDVTVESSHSDWEGTLIIESDDCPLVYADGEESEFSDGHLEIPVSGEEDSASFVCEDAEVGDEIELYIEDEEEFCSAEAEIESELPPGEGDLGELSQSIFSFNFSIEKAAGKDYDIFFAHDEDRIFFTAIYTPTGDESGSLTFTSDVWTDPILGYLGDESESGGKIYRGTISDIDAYGTTTIRMLGLNSSNEVGTEAIGQYVSDNRLDWVAYLQNSETYDAVLIEACTYSEEGDAPSSLSTSEVCYDPSTSPASGSVVIENVENIPSGYEIRIRTLGIVDSGLDCANDDDPCLTEQYYNTVTVSNGEEEKEAKASVVVLCPYIVTRGADIYLGQDIDSANVACIFDPSESELSDLYANSDGIVVIDSDGGELSVSSYVTEVTTNLTGSIAQDAVQMAINSQIIQNLRNSETGQSHGKTTFTSFSDLQSLANVNNPDNHILFFTEEISGGTPITLGNIVVPAGPAWTLVVDGDVILRSDITYASGAAGDLPASFAIIATGEIYVEDSAYQLNGIFYADSFNGDYRSPLYGYLKINGALIGDIEKLFDQAGYIGTVTRDEGSIVITTDVNVLLNPPPLIKEFGVKVED